METIRRFFGFLFRAGFPLAFLGDLSFDFARAPHVSAGPIPFRVVLDPGHGGSDLGTVYQASRGSIAEKQVTLILAREISRQLQSRGYEVQLTRDRDVELPLPQRTALANRLKADAFISIHMNSGGDPNAIAEGIETYILNHTSDAASKRLARLENSILTTQFSQARGQETAPNPESKDLALILKDLQLDANLKESKRLACVLQNSLVTATSYGVSIPVNLVSKKTERELLFEPKSFDQVIAAGNLIERRDRGVKQALFHVLLGADMPSVLVEAGFLNNRRDRSLLLSRKGQVLIGTAVADAVDQYSKQKLQFQKGTPLQAASPLDSCKIH